ncbi:unnamed protein product [Ixodes pacificus]
MHRLRELDKRYPDDDSSRSSRSSSAERKAQTHRGQSSRALNDTSRATDVKTVPPPSFCRETPRVGRNCHTLSKGGGPLVVNNADFQRSPTTRLRSGKRLPRGYDFQALEGLQNAPASEVVFTLTLKMEDFDALMVDATRNVDSLSALLQILMRACGYQQTAHLRLLLTAVAVKDGFLQNVGQQMTCRKREPLFWENYIKPLVIVLERTVELVPREKTMSLFGITTLLLDVVNSYLRESKQVDATVIDTLERVGLHLAKANEDDLRGLGRLRGGPFAGDGNGDEKPSTLPDAFLVGSQLNENFDGHPVCIKTLSDYVDAQYWNLRCLFLSPLLKLLKRLQSFPLPSDAPGVAIYTKVKVGQLVCIASGVGHKVVFNIVDNRSLDKQLLVGSTVCLSKDNFHTVFLGTVIWRSLKDDDRGHIVVAFLDPKRIDALVSLRGFVMIECPERHEDFNLVFEVLRQCGASQIEFPFERYIIGGQNDILRPKYIDGNTTFNMSNLFQRRVFVRPNRERDWPSFKETDLDSFQYDALQAALSRDMTLIEGMPGSGKMFLTKQLVGVMLDNIDVCQPEGPVIIVTKDEESLDRVFKEFENTGVTKANAAFSYAGKPTNHATGTREIYEVVESASGRLLRQHTKELGQLRSVITMEQEHAGRIPSMLLGESELKSVMTDQHYKSLFFSQDTVRDNVLSTWMQLTNRDVVSRFFPGNEKCLTDDEVYYLKDVWALDMESRYRLYIYWVSRYASKKGRDVSELVERYRSILMLQREVQEQMHAEFLNDAKIIGATVSSLPKVWKTLRSPRPQMVVVHGSREIPEAFLLPAVVLDPHHLVLFADTDNKFSHQDDAGHSVDSLFNRLVQQGLPCCQLFGQHRLSYQSIKVLEAFKRKKMSERYEIFSRVSSVPGVSCNVRFVSHEYCYDKDNLIACALEAEFAASLVKYLLLQGYLPGQIRVYTCSSGQAELIKSNMSDLSETPAVGEVVHAKGHQSDIVLLSFSSWYSGKDGGHRDRDFYHALASATKGLYVIANMRYLAEHVQSWKELTRVLETEAMVGPLELRCQLHPEKRTLVSNAKDFTTVSEGGCSTPCDAQLSCGHPCPRKCHLSDRNHTLTKCTKPCTKLLPCDHVCKALCGQPCSETCTVMVNVFSPCDHVVRVHCSSVYDPHTVRSACFDMCKKKISRGVRCAGVCGQCYVSGAHNGDERPPAREPNTSCNACLVM